MYIPDFWCGVIAGTAACITVLIIIARINLAKRKK